MPLDLYFPLLNGGVEQGLNDAGIETFKGEFQQHIVRECTQNALDAQTGAGAQVRVEIHLRQIPAADIPGLAALRVLNPLSAGLAMMPSNTAAPAPPVTSSVSLTALLVQMALPRSVAAPRPALKLFTRRLSDFDPQIIAILLAVIGRRLASELLSC